MNSHRKPCVRSRFFRFTVIGAAIVASASSLAVEHVKGQEACAKLASHNFAKSLKLDVQKAVANETEKFCLVNGIVNSRTGIDGKHYGIGFEMRLPLSWNGRFVYQMNGGNDGAIVPAEGHTGNGGASALARGYAVLSTNAGHAGDAAENSEYGLAAGNRFGLDPQARNDYGYAATASMTPVAHQIMRAFYNKSPEYSYLAGCSNGGRHGMVAASRYGEMFDGILVGAPGFNLPKAAVQHAWDVQTSLQVAPTLSAAFSRDNMAFLTHKVAQACDELDGLKDGLVNKIRECQSVFDINSLACAGEKAAGCWTDQQVKSFARLMAGPKNSKGEQLYNHWWYDTGLADNDWRFWKFESPIPAWNNHPLIAVMGAGSLAYLFTTPATEVEGTPEKLLSYLTRFDFDRDAPKIFATHGAFKQSAMEFMTPPDVANPKLADFRKSNGKLIIYHGQSDPVFSTVDLVDWYEKLDKNYQGKAADFARLFVVPGMNHCAGGPATDQFDALTALVDWVEKGIAPETITAKVNPDNKSLPADWSKTRSRPLCPWPRVAVYKKGDPDSAASFMCRLN